MASFTNMKETRKRKVDEEVQKFNERWIFDYFSLKIQIKDLCV